MTLVVCVRCSLQSGWMNSLQEAFYCASRIVPSSSIKFSTLRVAVSCTNVEGTCSAHSISAWGIFAFFISVWTSWVPNTVKEWLWWPEQKAILQGSSVTGGLGAFIVFFDMRSVVSKLWNFWKDPSRYCCINVGRIPGRILECISDKIHRKIPKRKLYLEKFLNPYRIV